MEDKIINYYLYALIISLIFGLIIYWWAKRNL